jgi:hypothetical protein
MIETILDLLDKITDESIEKEQNKKRSLQQDTKTKDTKREEINNKIANNTKIKIPSDESPTLITALLSFFENLKKK